MKNAENELSLGHTTLRAHKRRGTPLINLNFVCPEPRLPLPSPEGDSYLRQTAIAAVRPGEMVLCNMLIPGLLDYYQRVKLVPDKNQVVEIEPGEKHGFPHSDPLERLRSNGEVVANIYNDSRLILTSTFSGDAISAQARRLGIDILDRPDSVITNDKALLRKNAEKYRIQMLPGVCIDDWESVDDAVEKFGSLRHGVWLKAPGGSGGDLVYHIKKVTRDSLLAGRELIRNAVITAFSNGKFSASINDYWPKDRMAPIGSAIVIESDVRNHGEIVANGSTQFVTHKSGKVEIIGHFKQMTSDEGEYLGNRPYKPNESDKKDILTQVRNVARLSLDEKYYGIQGVDWFIVKSANGRNVTYVVERNARPTANTPPTIMADKLGIKEWINTNVYTDTPVRKIDDYIDIVGANLAFGDPLKDGLVIPQAFRTTVTRRRVTPSPNFKILIAGKSSEHCDTIVQELKRRGVRFSPS